METTKTYYNLLTDRPKLYYLTEKKQAKFVKLFPDIGTCDIDKLHEGIEWIEKNGKFVAYSINYGY